MADRRSLRRGAVKKAEAEFIGFWLPRPVAAALDQAVMITDSDRSKLIRSAVQEKLSKIRLDLIPQEAGK